MCCPPDGRFMADNVLAKHDENYLPEGMAEKLKTKGVWKGAAQSEGGREMIVELGHVAAGAGFRPCGDPVHRFRFGGP